MASRAVTERTIHPKPARRRAARAAGARQEIERLVPERAPLPGPAGLADTLSPVDLPEPAVALPHPLRWTTTVIAVAALFLLLFNAPALRGWSYQLAPSDQTARVVTAAEGWYDLMGKAGFNYPVETMHARWQSVRDARFGAKPAQTSDAADAAASSDPKQS